MQNSVPTITFVMASTLRKKLILWRECLAKILGTISSVGGAIIITLYKGLPLLQTQQSQQPPEIHSLDNKTQNYTRGCIYILGQLGTSGKSLLVDGIDDKGFSTEAHGCAIIEVLGKDKHNEVLATLHK
ncbi:auxin-induced protein 5NG4-like [Apium graveolens]|uniref:auxin-induced protein 5NG4-like n=1 Tax=Apium graveolens TaxID=4045 RepID=UPI003D7B8586